MSTSSLIPEEQSHPHSHSTQTRRWEVLWEMRLKPNMDNNEGLSRRAYEELVEAGESEEGIIEEYRRYKREFLDANKNPRYAKNLTKWLTNPDDTECYKRRQSQRKDGSVGEFYKPFTFKVSKGLAVDDGIHGRLLLGWYQPGQGDDWLEICTGERTGRPSWQPIPMKMMPHYVSAGHIKEGNFTEYDWPSQTDPESPYPVAIEKRGAANAD